MRVAQPQAAEPVPLRQAIAELFERSDERDGYLKRILAAWREGYLRGHGDGYAAGRADEAAERDAAWRELAGPVAHGEPFAETERRRWRLRGEPRTRATFGRPHPDDHQGNDAA